MKKFTYLLSSLALTFLLTAPAYAQYATPTATPTSARDRFASKLSTIRDEKKKAIVQKMDQLISQLNARRTAIMLRHLEKIEEILGRVEMRTDTLAAEGKDVTTVRTAITKARDAIAAARTKVNAQSTKSYTINITTEANLGSAVSTARLALGRDLQAAHQSVVTARKAVRDVLVALSKVVGEKLTSTVNE